jgi:hypothetical protein
MESYRAGWEQTRFVAYITAQTQSTKKLKIEDIMRFPWDRQQKKNKTAPVDAETHKRMVERMKKYENET